jgi:hypothetical protein
MSRQKWFILKVIVACIFGKLSWGDFVDYGESKASIYFNNEQYTLQIKN